MLKLLENLFSGCFIERKRKRRFHSHPSCNVVKQSVCVSADD